MSKISFTTQLIAINNHIIVHLPPGDSALLPSRGMVMVAGTINDIPFKTLLEPDGKYGPGKKPSHWFIPDEEILRQASLKRGDEIRVSIEATKDWIDPEIPNDFKKALSSSPTSLSTWNDITPLARWDWIRWIRAVKTLDTRKKHIDIALGKLNKGLRRPCCFNRNLCSDPEVSSNWVLLDPS